MTGEYIIIRMIPMRSAWYACGVAVFVLYAYYLGWWARKLWHRRSRWAPVCKVCHAGAVVLDLIGVAYCCACI